MDIVFIRHGESVYNAKNNVYGVWGSGGLTDKGIDQAKKAAADLLGHTMIIYSSPLRRASQTAEIIGNSIDSTIITDVNFIELQYGNWEGLTEAEIIVLYPEEYDIWETNPSELDVPGRETLGALQERVIGRIKEIIATNNHNIDVGIVTHSAIIRVALLHVEGRDLDDYRSIEIPNAKWFSINCKEF